MNELIGNSASETLKAFYTRKVIENNCKITEPIWMNKEIRNEIKERKGINRLRRNTTEREEKAKLFEIYQIQKIKLQNLIKEEMYKHEEKITREIRERETTGERNCGKLSANIGTHAKRKINN